MKRTWYELYMEEINEKGTYTNYVTEKIKTKKELISLIEKYSPNKRIIETGSGTGVLSTYMASLGYDSMGIDINEEILNLSKIIAKEYGKINKPKFKIDSIFELNYEPNSFDVAFSNGVLEHFSDNEIISTIKKQMKIANIVIIGIPTKYFSKNEAMYGDERFLSLSYWRKLIRKSGGVIIEEKSNHFLTKKEILLNFKKYFRPFPFRIFVVKKK